MAKTVAQKDVTILELILFHVSTGVVNRYEILIHHIDGRRLSAFCERDTDSTISTSEIKTDIAFSNIQVFNQQVCSCINRFWRKKAPTLQKMRGMYRAVLLGNQLLVEGDLLPFYQHSKCITGSIPEKVERIFRLRVVEAMGNHFSCVNFAVLYLLQSTRHNLRTGFVR